MSLYRRLTLSTLLNLVNVAANIVVGLVLTPFLINTLGAAAYGLWVFVLSLSVLRGFLGVFNLGLHEAVIKFVAECAALKQQDRLNAILSAALLAYSAIGLVVSVLLVGIALFGMSLLRQVVSIPDDLVSVARILFLLLAAQTMFDFPALVPTSLLEGLQRYDLTRLSNLLRLIVVAALSVLLVKAGMSVYGLALAAFTGELSRLVFHLLSARHAAPKVRLTRQIPEGLIRQITVFSGQMFAFQAMLTVYNAMDAAIIAARLSTTRLTDYDISDRIHTLVFALATLIPPLAMPAASALFAQGDRPELRRLIIRATRYTAALTVPVALIVIALAEPLTVFWLGPAYRSTVPATRLFIGYLLVWPLRAGQNMLIGVNRLNTVLPIYGAGLLINLLISLLAAPILGVSGVILGTTIGNSLIVLPYLILFNRAFGMSARDLGGVLLRVYPQALAGMGVALTLLIIHPPVNLIETGLIGSAGLLTFGGLFWLTGMPTEERRAFWKMIRMGLQ